MHPGVRHHRPCRQCSQIGTFIFFGKSDTCTQWYLAAYNTVATIKVFSLSNMCIEPPLPFEHPVALPYISAIIALGVTLCQGMCVIAVSGYHAVLLFITDMAPANTASCPIYRWQKPAYFCCPYNCPVFSSNLRIKSIDSYHIR
jgi:hypothetical protein